MEYLQPAVGAGIYRKQRRRQVAIAWRLATGMIMPRPSGSYRLSKKVAAEIVVQPGPSKVQGALHIEFQDGRGEAALRIAFDSTGISAKTGARWKKT